VKVESLLDLIGNTPMVRLRHLEPAGTALYAKLEGENPTGSVKDRIAKAMIERAETQGLLDEDRILLEPTSGNTGISLALICRLKGIRFAAVMASSMTGERRTMLEMYGAEIHLSPGEEGSNGAIRVATEMAQDPKYQMLNQYENPANPDAHEFGTATEIIRDLPDVEMFCAGLGTGGTLTGVGRGLKKHSPSVKIVGMEPPAGELIQGLRSLEEGYVPPVLDKSVIDRSYLVRGPDAFRMTRELFEREGIFAGVSSGGAVVAALRAIRALKPKTAVVLLADGGWKYLSTGVYHRDPDEVEKEMEGKIWW
jgi:cysteine synthase B